MTDLKPCPFCGGKAHLSYFGRDDPRYDNSETEIYCGRCKASICRSGNCKDKVTELWNRRVEE